MYCSQAKFGDATLVLDAKKCPIGAGARLLRAPHRPRLKRRSLGSASDLYGIRSIQRISAPTTMGSCNRPRNCPLGVTLRNFTLEDIKPSLQWFGDDEVTMTTPNDSFRSEEEAQRYFATTIAGHPWYRLICVDGEPAGAIYLTLGTGAHRVRGDLSYILAKEYWGKGVMTKATALAVKAGFTEFGLYRIQAYTLPTNIGSQRVLEKCGYHREGLLRNFVRVRGKLCDVFVFAICRDDENVDESEQ